MQKINFIIQLILEMELTQYMHNFGHALVYLLPPTCDVSKFADSKDVKLYIKIKLHTSTRSWDIVVSRIQHFEWSGTKTQEPAFSQACRKLDDRWYFHIKVKKVYMNGLDFCENPRKLIFGPFFELTRPAWPDWTFFQNSGLVTFLTLWLSIWLSSCKKLEKNDDPLLRF